MTEVAETGPGGTGGVDLGAIYAGGNGSPGSVGVGGGGGTGDYAGATVADNGYNLVGTVSGGASFAGTGTRTGVTDPQLGTVANNGGQTQTRLPQRGSPAINAGAATCDVAYTDAATGRAVTLATDQRGVQRPQGVR